MKNLINVLIVEDEPLIIGNLETALNHLEKDKNDLEFKIKTAKNCDDAGLEIDKAIQNIPIDLAILDLRIPKSKDLKYISGEDLGLKIKYEFPNAKIVIFTSYSNNARLTSVLKSIDPDGLIIKTDIDYSELLIALETVIYDPPFYSNSVLKLLRKQFVHEFFLDKYDRKILHEISEGTKNCKLPGIIGLSKGGIEHRKRRIKEVFDMKEGDDGMLIKEAKLKGFI